MQMLDDIITDGPGVYLKRRGRRTAAAAGKLCVPTKTETQLLPGWKGWNSCPRLPTPPGVSLPPDTWLFGSAMGTSSELVPAPQQLRSLRRACLHEVGLDGRDTLVQQRSRARGRSAGQGDSLG